MNKNSALAGREGNSATGLISICPSYGALVTNFELSSLLAELRTSVLLVVFITIIFC